MEPKETDIIAQRFELHRLIGRGFFGSTWEAEDRQTGATCIVKTYTKEDLGPASKEYVQYVGSLRESLGHREVQGVILPNIEGEEAHFIYQVLPYVPRAITLEQLILRLAPMPPRDALDILAKVSRVLAVVHGKGVVHADIKPPNILVTQNGERSVHLIDFGMARRADSNDGVLLMGTPQYMHPELASGRYEERSGDSTGTAFRAKSIATYVDIYSLGLVTLAMLTGTPKAPYPCTSPITAELLRSGNQRLRSCSAESLQRLANLVVDMLSVGAARQNLSAQEISLTAASLKSAWVAEDEEVATETALTVLQSKTTPATLSTDVEATLERIQAIVDGLAASTAALFLY